MQYRYIRRRRRGIHFNCKQCVILRTRYVVSTVSIVYLVGSRVPKKRKKAKNGKEMNSRKRNERRRPVCLVYRIVSYFWHFNAFFIFCFCYKSSSHAVSVSSRQKLDIHFSFVRFRFVWIKIIRIAPAFCAFLRALRLCRFCWFFVLVAVGDAARRTAHGARTPTPTHAHDAMRTNEFNFVNEILFCLTDDVANSPESASPRTTWSDDRPIGLPMGLPNAGENVECICCKSFTNDNNKDNVWCIVYKYSILDWLKVQSTLSPMFVHNLNGNY